LFGVSGFILAGFAATCFADDINWTADMVVRTQHQDNVTLSGTNPLADTSVQLGINSRGWRKTPSQETELGLALKDDKYLEYTEFEQDARSLSLVHTIKQELGSYSIKADATRSTTLANGFESGDFVRRNAAVHTRAFSASGNRYLNEFISVSMTAGASRGRYQHIFDSDNQDYNNVQYSAAVIYQDDQTASWQLSVYVDSLDQLQNGFDVETTGATLQRSYKWNEIWSLTGKLGRRKTDFTGRTFLGGEFNQEDYGRVSALDIKRGGEISSWGLGASEDLSPRVNGVIDETQRLGIWWETKPSLLSVLKVSVSHVRREPINTSFISDDATRYNSVTTGWQYAINETLSTDIQLRWVERALKSSANSDSASGGSAALGLRWLMHP
jgi:hypothetical protein